MADDRIPVPDVTGFTQTAAETALRSTGLTVGTVTTASSPAVAAGNIISTTPPAGTMAPPGSPVDLTVSSGPAPAQIAVPDVTGQAQAAAATALTNAGLVLGTVTTASSPAVAAGNIISTTPPAGTPVAPGSPVDLNVSSGPAQIAVPDVTGFTQTAAETALRSTGLTVGTVTTASSPAVAAGNIISTTPPAGTPVAPGSPVDLNVSSGPAQITVPDVTGFTQTAAETALRSTGLVLGTVTTAQSSVVPSGGVISTSPSAGQVVSNASAVNLVISTGQRIGFWQSVWQNLTTIIFIAISLIMLGLIGWGISGQGGFLLSLGKQEVARGLITFLITLITVGIALILVLSTIPLSGNTDQIDAINEKRFDRGKQVLTAMIGILGTIVGFYFASLQNPQGQIQITTASLPAGVVNADYPPTALQAAGGTPPLRWSAEPQLPAGLNLETATGLISGRPTRASSTTHRITVTDSATPIASSSKDLSLEIRQNQQGAGQQGAGQKVEITTESLPDGAVNTTYEATIQTTGGKPPLKWSVTPALSSNGLSLAPADATTAIISGKPTMVLRDKYTVSVTDSATPATSASKDFTLNVKQ